MRRWSKIVGAWIVVGGCLADDGAPALREDSSDSGSGDTAATTTAATETGTGGNIPDPAGPDAAPDPSTFGPFPVGVRTVELSDASRTVDMAPRPLVVEVWYPATEDARDEEPIGYSVDEVLRPEAVAALPPAAAQLTLPSAAVRDAAVRIDDGPFPLVLFSHGSFGVRMQSTYLTEALASHGYVVASADHIGNTLSDAILDPDGTSDAMVLSFVDRPTDMTFVLDHFSALAPDDPLAGAVDSTRVGVSGHSFGALTSLRWMGMGAAVDAVVAQATPPLDLTWMFLPDPLSTFDTPVMLHVGGIDDTTTPADAESIWFEATPPRARLTLATGGHFTFSDLCSFDRATLEAIAEAGLLDSLDDGCSDVNIDPTVAFPAVRHYAIGYFNVHLRDSAPTADLLTQAEGERLAGDEVTFELEP